MSGERHVRRWTAELSHITLRQKRKIGLKHNSESNFFRRIVMLATVPRNSTRDDEVESPWKFLPEPF